MNTIQVGFIGCGTHSGRRLYPALRSAGLNLAAVCDVDETKAEVRAAEYHVKYYTGWQEMCDSEALDAVLISIGPQAHYELTIPLVERGYHVWTEKPPSYTAAQADEIMEVATKARRVVQTGFNYRYTLGIQKSKDLIESGAFGPPAMVAVRWWLGVSDHIGFMHHYVVHAADLLNYLTPGELTRMHIEHQHRAGVDYYMVTFRAPDGVIAVLEATANMSIFGHWCRVDWMSKDGMLSVRDFTEITHHTAGPWGRQAPPDSSTYEGDRIWRTESLFAKGRFIDIWGYVTELDYFRQAVLGYREPESTIREAAWSMHVCEALMEASAATQDSN